MNIFSVESDIHNAIKNYGHQLFGRGWILTRHSQIDLFKLQSDYQSLRIL